MRRIELKRANIYNDMKTGITFQRGKIYTVKDETANRLLEQVTQRDDPYFRDHGEISKKQIQENLRAQEERKRIEEAARKRREFEEKESVILDDILEEQMDADSKQVAEV